MKRIAVITLLILSCFALINQVIASLDLKSEIFEIAKVSKQYVFKPFDQQIALKVFLNTFKSGVKIKLSQLDAANFTLPEGYVLDSNMYQYEVLNVNQPTVKKAFSVTLNYDVDYILIAEADYVDLADDYSQVSSSNLYAGFIDYNEINLNPETDYSLILDNDYNQIQGEKDTNFDRAIWVYNTEKNIWQRIKSYNYFDDKIVTARINKTKAIVAILKKAVLMTEGQASWYKYKNCDCAASPDYPKGTKLKVTNTNNGKSVVVTINDWGPERDVFSNRVIDLDVTAFKKIANKRLGVCAVKIEPVTEEQALE